MIDPRVQQKALQMASYGTGIAMPFVRPGVINQLEQEQAAADAAAAKQSQPEIINLAAHIRKAWTRNRTAKQPYEDQMIADLLQRAGKYDSTTAARIKAQGGSEIFMNITSPKCRAVEAWLYEIMLPNGERPYSYEPTPIPDLSDDIEQEMALRIQSEYQQVIAQGVQLGTINPAEIPKMLEQAKADIQQAIKDQAEKDAKQFEDEVDDELVEGGWYDAMRKVIPDIVTLPFGCVAGPDVQHEKVLTWSTYPDGTPYAIVDRKPIRKYRRVNPFDLYPAPGATSPDDGDLIERMRLKRSELISFIGAPGFDDSAIRLVLEQFGQRGYREWLANDMQRQEAENRSSYVSSAEDDEIDCLKFMGSVQGTLLLQWGMSTDIVQDPLEEYDIKAYLIGQYVIFAKLNDDPLGRRNYFCTSLEKSNDSICGKGVPELMAPQQRVCNGCARAIVNNMGHASGPMYWFYANMIEGPVPTRIVPWMQLQMRLDPQFGNVTSPVGFFQPQVIVEQLLKVFQYFFEMASETTGVPQYIYGSQQGSSGSATDTASGLGMMMNAASKTLKSVAGHIDNDIVKNSLKAHWLHIMLYEPQRAKGDINVVARASEYLLQQEMLQVRRNEFLANTNNPTDNAIIGVTGRAEVLREAVKGLKMPVDRIVPDRKQIADMKVQNEMQMAMQDVFQKIAGAVGIPVETVAQIAAGGQAAPAGSGKSRTLGPDGKPVGGQDARLMQ